MHDFVTFCLIAGAIVLLAAGHPIPSGAMIAVAWWRR